MSCASEKRTAHSDLVYSGVPDSLMSAQIRVGIAGIRHGHAKTLVNQWRELDNVQIVAAADEFESARSLARDTWSIPNIYETWQELIDREDLDVVTATLPNTQHADVVDSVATIGLPILIEKPMAASLTDAERMVRATETANVPAMVNWPNLGEAAYEAGVSLISEGVIGQPHQFTFRGGNSIATTKLDQPDWFQWLFKASEGGGSWIDYAGYGAIPCLMWMGRPKRMIAQSTTVMDPYAQADETATAILEFENGMGLLQTSHIQIGFAGPQGKMMHIEINGDEGTLLLKPGDPYGELWIYDNKDRTNGVHVPTQPQASERSTGVAYMAQAIRTGCPIEGRSSFRFNREVVSIIDAGRAAMTSSDAVVVPPTMDC